MAGRSDLAAGRALMCGFYLNELLLRLLARGDPHELLYDRYVGTSTSSRVRHCATDYERILRRFEKNLLSEIGYGATFDVDADNGTPIDPAGRYVFQPERGALRASGQPAVRYPGKP